MRNDANRDMFLVSGLSESGYIDPNQTQILYFRDPILAKENVNISFGLHVMTGKARLKAKICALNFTDKYEDYKDSCTITTEQMLEGEPKERIESHMGAESEPTNTEVCKLP